LYAVAISPDGKTIATGGWTGYEWEKTHSIYLFDHDSGRLIQRIPGLPNVIHYLAYSNDGRFLVATVGARTAFVSIAHQTTRWRQRIGIMAVPVMVPTSIARGSL
jgi:uncharacterized protein YjiK